MTEIGIFFCSNCCRQIAKDVPYEAKPKIACPTCGFDDAWIFEPTGDDEK